MEEIKKEIQIIKSLEDQNDKLEKEIGEKKQKIFRAFKNEFNSWLDDKEFTKMKWDRYGLSKEIQLILQSMLKRNKIYSLGNELHSSKYYITQQHGLKFPRRHCSHCFLPNGYREQETTFDKNLIWNEDKSQGDSYSINFSTLKEIKDIDLKRFDKFIYFLKEIISLYSKWKKINKFLDLKEVSGLTKLREYSSIDDFENFIVKAPDLKIAYSKWVIDVDKYFKDKETLLLKLQEYNKPYRVFLELKKEPEN